jgi:hypothetical protein
VPQLTALDVNPFYPALSAWLARAVQGNAWAEMLAGAVGGTDVLLDAMEEIATTLDAANPLRLDGKRKVLRRDADSANLLNMRLELLLAYRLVTASVYFEFGGQGQPDLICDVPGGKRVWVEVTSRSRSMRDFRDSSALGKHFDAVHRELVNVLNIKNEQAERDGFDPMTPGLAFGPRPGRSGPLAPLPSSHALTSLSLF